MSKITPTKPFLMLLYGFPGSGKTYLSRQLTDKLQAAHIQADRIRHELFQQPRYDKEENAVVAQIVDYMTEEFLQAGVSVIYDVNSMRLTQRRNLRDLARRVDAEPILVWQQIDTESAMVRSMKRDKRRSDDRYALQPDQATFQKLAGAMQNPSSVEEYVVVSGKHVFGTQLSTLVRYMLSRGILTTASGQAKNLVKPGLVNLIPSSQIGRVEASPNRRINII